MATLILRNTKGSALTFDELDSNFLALDSDITSINNTLSSGVGLGADSVNQLIDARIDSDDFVDLTTVQTITGAKTFNGGITVSSGLIANSLTYPTADGNTGEFLKTDGAGNLTFAVVTSYDSTKVQGQIDSDFGTRTTAELTELTNLYYTDARARAAISATGDITYNDVTGVISFTDSEQHTPAQIRAMFSAAGDLAYNSTTGQFSFTDSEQHTPTQIRAMFSAAGDLAYNSTTGQFSFTDSEQHTPAQIRAMFSASGDLAYNSTTGDFSFTDSEQHTPAQIRAMFSAAGDLSYNSGTGEFSYTDSSPFAVQFAAASIFGLSDVTSGTVVTNLNADKVDGYNGIAVYDRNGTLLN